MREERQEKGFDAELALAFAVFGGLKMLTQRAGGE